MLNFFWNLFNKFIIIDYKILKTSYYNHALIVKKLLNGYNFKILHFFSKNA
jgi:hypothetical protein